MVRFLVIPQALLLLTFSTGCGTDDSGDGDPDPQSEAGWVMYEPDGAKCADGSQYRFFVEFSDDSDNVVIFFEGGGACWDYESCTANGARSAANRDGIPETHAEIYATIENVDVPINDIFPVLNSDEQVTPTHNWNKVFVPYCTGDVHAGNTEVVYESENDGDEDLRFAHWGRNNVLAMLSTLETLFTDIPKLLVGGCSAGGAGSIINYDTIRRRLDPEYGYLLNDSGPIFPENLQSSRSSLLYARAVEAWELNKTLDDDPDSEKLKADFGSINTLLASRYPNDRLATTFFQLDYNYSLYSYERFYTRNEEDDTPVPFKDGTGLGGLGLDLGNPKDRTAVYRLWADDTTLLREQYDATNNLAYYMPFYRKTSDSHCLIVPGFEERPPLETLILYRTDFPTLAWLGTELNNANNVVNVKDFLNQLLNNDEPLESYFEDEGEGEYLSCVPKEKYYNEDQCAQAVNTVESTGIYSHNHYN